MRKTLIAATVAGLFSLPSVVMAQAAAPASPHTFTGNVGIASEYLYRGIAQTRGKPALQGGFDYAHASGLYAGVWGSNISWIGDAVAGASASLEIDVYGGYKGSFGGDFGYDIGVLTYNYPGTGKTVTGVQELKQDTTEVYGALSWKWLTVKYSHSTSALFGWAKNPGALTDKTTGSSYLELNAAYDLGNGWGITGHIGDQKVKGNSPASYTDYKLGVTKDLNGWLVGLAYIGTDAKGSCNAANPGYYCFGNKAPIVPGTTKTKDVGDDTVVLSITKSF